MGITNWDAIQNAVRVLNEALEADPDAINELILLQVHVNEKLAQHPSIQVFSPGEENGERIYRLRPLGLINGLFGVNEFECGYIAAQCENEEPHRIIRFVYADDWGRPND